MNAIASMFIAQLGKDAMQINASIDRFVEQARRIGARVYLAVHPHGQRGFDALDDDDISRRIVQDTLDLIKEHL